MARLVSVLIPSVRTAREWLMQTELRLKEEGKESFIQGSALGLGILGSADPQASLPWALTLSIR